ncbi:MAG: pseudouridine synthase [Calditrichia bacterium]
MLTDIPVSPHERQPHSRHHPQGEYNQGWIYYDRIPKAWENKTVLDFYARNYMHSSREMWRERIEKGLILLDGKTCAADTRLKPGQQLSYRRLPWKEPPVPIDYTVLFQDEHLLAVHKPAGLPVLPNATHLKNTLLNILRGDFAENLTPLHRLGTGTSGVVLFAQTDLARKELSRQFRQCRVEKIYRALVQGIPQADYFTINEKIGKIPYAPLGYIYAASPDGKWAMTCCRVLQKMPGQNCSLLQVKILTGRPHQIRIHLAAAGYPLLGEPLYQKDGKPGLPPPPQSPPLPGDLGYSLHAHQVRFDHPLTQESVLVEARPPEILRLPGE